MAKKFILFVIVSVTSISGALAGETCKFSEKIELEGYKLDASTFHQQIYIPIIDGKVLSPRSSQYYGNEETEPRNHCQIGVLYENFASSADVRTMVRTYTPVTIPTTKFSMSPNSVFSSSDGEQPYDILQVSFGVSLDTTGRFPGRAMGLPLENLAREKVIVGSIFCAFEVEKESSMERNREVLLSLLSPVIQCQ